MSDEEILPDEALSPEELAFRKKGQALANLIGGYLEDALQRYPLTEERVREIVRDEINKWERRTVNHLRVQGRAL